jgi:hypothetical protein
MLAIADVAISTRASLAEDHTRFCAEPDGPVPVRPGNAADHITPVRLFVRVPKAQRPWVGPSSTA